MSVIRQIGVVFGLCWISEIIASYLPFAFPSSVLALVLLFVLLLTGVLKTEHVKEKSDFLLDNMAFFFIPAGVRLMNYFDLLKENIITLVVICVITTVLTFAATAYSMSFTIKLLNRRKKHD